MLSTVRLGLRHGVQQSQSTVLFIRTISSKKLLAPGDTFETVEEFGKDRVARFVSVTGDANILHTDPDGADSEFQGATRLRGALVPGSLCASLFPAIIGTTFPGALYLSQTLKFRNPATVGSKVRAVVTAKKVSGRRVVFDTTCRLVDPTGGPELIIVDGEAIARMQSWSPNESREADSE